MLLHITPRICVVSPAFVDLVDIRSDVLGFTLTARDIVARKPSPNKKLLVGCRRKPRKAVDGLLLETDRPFSSFDIRSRWAVDAEVVVTQVLHYKVLDKRFGAASDNGKLWCAEDGFEDVTPKHLQSEEARPPLMMSQYHAYKETIANRDRLFVLTPKLETFEMPTIEPERIFGAAYDTRGRFPTMEMVLRV